MDRSAGSSRIEGLMNRWRQPQSSFVSQSVSTDDRKDSELSGQEDIPLLPSALKGNEEKIRTRSVLSDLRHVIELTKREIGVIQGNIDSLSRYSDDMDGKCVEMSNALSHSQIFQQGLSLSSAIEQTRRLTQDACTSTEDDQMGDAGGEEMLTRLQTLRSLCYIQERRLAELEVSQRHDPSQQSLDTEDMLTLEHRLKEDVESEKRRVRRLERSIRMMEMFKLELPQGRKDAVGDTLQPGLEYEGLCFQVRKALRELERERKRVCTLTPSSTSLKLIRARDEVDRLERKVKELEQERASALHSEVDKQHSIKQSGVDGILHSREFIKDVESQVNEMFLHLKRGVKDLEIAANENEKLLERVRRSYMVVKMRRATCKR